MHRPMEACFVIARREAVPRSLEFALDMRMMQKLADKLLVSLEAFLGVAFERGFKLPARMEQRLGEAQADFILQDDADDAEGGAAQRERVFRAGRLLVDGPEADEHVELVGERDRDGDGIRGNGVRRPLRLVVLGDGVGDGRLLALRERDIAPDHALQLGELAHRFRHQVGFREMRRALRVVRIGAGGGRKLPRQALDATAHAQVASRAFRGR